MAQQSKAVQHLQSINIDDEWETPPKLLQDACEKYDIHPQLDVCATDQNHKFPLYFTKESNALHRIIDVPFYMNGAYSIQKQLMKHVYEQHCENNVDGLILAFAKTGVKWWHQYVEDIAEVHFIQGRIPFWKDGKPYYYLDKKTQKLKRGYAPYDSAWIIYRSRK